MILFCLGAILGFLFGIIVAALLGAAHDADASVIPPPPGRL